MSLCLSRDVYIFTILCVVDVARELSEEVKEKFECLLKEFNETFESSTTELKEIIESSITEVKEKIESSTKKVKKKNESSIEKLKKKVESSTKEIKKKNESSTKELQEKIESSAKEIKEEVMKGGKENANYFRGDIAGAIAKPNNIDKKIDRLEQSKEGSTRGQKSNLVNLGEKTVGELDSVNYLFYPCDLC